MSLRTTVFSSLVLLFLSSNLYAEEAKESTYEIVLENLWNAQDHLAFPQNAHFSPIVALSHNSEVALFRLGELASSSFEGLAETGATRSVLQDIERAEMIGRVKDYVETDSLFPRRDGPSISLQIKVSEEHSLLSFATMIAPSPDWVVGLDSLDLFKSGAFIEEIKMNLYALNAGTESGDRGGNFSIQNPASRPHEVISRLKGEGFEAPFARLTIRKL